MFRRFNPVLVVMALSALAAPAAAGAAPEITVSGAKAPLGTQFKGTSSNTVVKTVFGTIACGTVEFGAEVTANTGATFASVASAPMKTATCFIKGITPVTFDDPTLLSLHSSTKGKGTVGLTFEITVPELTCHYFGAAIPFTYTSGGSSLTLKGGLTVKPAACGSATIEGTFSLSSSGGAVVLD